MRILIVEDDYLQAEELAQKITEHFCKVDAEFVRTEHEFRERLNDLRRNPPDLFLLDVMLRWTDPIPKMVTPPPEVEVGGPFRAGLRCERLLRESPETRETPVVLYTVLEDEDLGSELEHLGNKTFYVSKDSDAQPLFEVIKGVLPPLATRG